MKAKSFYLAVVVSLFFTLPAFAADTQNWAGFYVGLNGGYGWGSARTAFLPGGSGSGVNLFSPYNAGGTFHKGMDGGIFGGQFGLNYQKKNIVLGLEVSGDWSNVHGKESDYFYPTVPFPSTALGTEYSTRMQWFATLTPRLGYAFSNFLPYIKGGLAAGRVQSRLSSPLGYSFSDGNDQIGWTIGAGIEYAMHNWILGLEYNYYDFGTQHYGGEVKPNTTFPLDYTVRPAFSSVLMRVSYLFQTNAENTKVVVVSAADTRNWAGFYVGFNGGYGWGSARTAFLPGGSGSSSSSNLFSPYNAGGTFHKGMDGGIFGGQFGLNYQKKNIVLGLEVSGDWSNVHGKESDYFYPTVALGTEYSTRMQWFATLTPRLGYAFSNFLPYIKGGLAAGRVQSNLSSPLGYSFSDGNDQIGWTVGAGIEYAMHNWILGLEYNYYDFGTQHYGGEVTPNTTWPVDYTLRPSFSSVLMRVSYLFQ